MAEETMYTWSVVWELDMKNVMQLDYCRQHIWLNFNLELETSMYTYIELHSVGRTNVISIVHTIRDWVECGLWLIFQVFGHGGSAIANITPAAKHVRVALCQMFCF